MSESTERGSGLAAVRARAALRDAGLDPTVELTPASSVTNEVWLSPTHVVRVNTSRRPRLAREARIAQVLPRAVRYPDVVRAGTRLGEEWLISTRAPGTALAHVWPDLDGPGREFAVRELARMLEALHGTPAPAGLAPLEGAPHPLAFDTPDPLCPLLSALDRLERVDNVDALVVREARDAVRAYAPFVLDGAHTTLVHGDLTFENVLAAGPAVTALLDLEWARVGPPDLDLDILLRMCAHPELHVAPAHRKRAHANDYAPVPHWLADAYPGLFAEPHLLERLRLYSIAFNVRDLILDPPAGSLRQVPPLHPYHRLIRVLSGRSHLDELERQGFFSRLPVP
ncbi:MAG: phosphotransferase family protein [Acidimicrobiia bacterium]